MGEESWAYTCCPGWGDHDFCVLKTVVRDGKIDHTERVEYSGNEADCGHICQKGILSWRQAYNKERLLHPLKRVGERGEGKWEQISWDQALDEIAEKLLEIREKHGPQSLCVWNLAAGSPPALGMAYMMAQRFAGAWGATDCMHGLGLDNGAQYSIEVDMGGNDYFYTDPRLMYHSDLIIPWGCNPVENQPRIATCIVEGKSNGAEVIDVGLVFDATAGYADQFIPVKPGSDAALALAIAKVLIDEDLYDHEFVLNHTVAPILVSEEDGKFLRDEYGLWQTWNTAQGEAQMLLPHTHVLVAEETALEGEYTVDGVKCKPVFQLLREHLERYTLEYEESVTGVPAQTALEFARKIGHADGIFFDIAFGMRYLNQGETHRAVTLLAALTGNLGKENGGCGFSMNTSAWPVIYNVANVIAAHGIEPDGEILGPNYVKMEDFFAGAARGEYKAFIKAAGNPVHNTPNRNMWLNDVVPNMELIVDFDIWMTDTGEIADYVLPDCMPFERTEVVNVAGYGHYMLQTPAIEPVGENKTAWYLYTELAKRTGLGEYFTKTEDEYFADLFDFGENVPPQLVDEKGPITYERLKEERMIRANNPQTVFNPMASGDFITPTGRVEIYAENYADIDEAFAKYKETIEFPLTEESKHPYQFFTGRQRFFMQSMFTDDALLAKMSGGKPFARMNPADAEAEGLKTGDYIEVYNDRGHVFVELRLDEAVPPKTVHVWFGWRRRAYEGGTYAEMTVPCGCDEATDELSDRWWNLQTNGGNIGSMFAGHLDWLEGAWDTLWDVTCSVRKATKEEAANA